MRKRTVQASIIQSGLLTLLVLLGWGAAAPEQVTTAAAWAPTVPPSVGNTAFLTNESINTTPLPEAVQEIDLRLGRASYPGCLDVFEEPTLDFKTDNLELTGIAMIATCGWQPEEVVKITLMDPSGKITTSEAAAVPSKYKKNVYEVNVYYQPGVDAAPGKYRFTLEGSGTVKAKVEFNRPQNARLYVMADDPFHPHHQAMGGKQRLRLHGFLPNESIRLLAYRFEGTKIQFYGWKDYITGSGGQLIIETNLTEISEETEMNYFAYARETHFVALERFTREGYSKTRQFDMDLYCPGAPAPRLSGVTEIRGAASTAQINVNQQPGYGSRLLVQLPGDASLRLFGYPKCIDRAYWWKVSVKDPLRFGWVAESFLGKYQVQPVE